MDRITNTLVLKIVGKRQAAIKAEKGGGDTLISFVLCHEGLCKTTIEGRVEGNNARVQPKKQYMFQLIMNLQHNT